MKDKISIIIPFFDGLDFLKRAINSVLQQSYKKFELIIIYDNPENKENLKSLKKFIFKKSKIKLLINKKNIGAGYSRNKGIKNSNGNYIAFLDSDDFWKKNKLFLQMKFMKKTNLLISHTSYDIIDVNGNFLNRRKASDLKYIDLIKSCDVGLSTVIINRKLLKKTSLFPNLKTKEDYVLWLKISSKGITFKGLNQSLTKWTKRPKSLSSSTFQKIKDAFSVYSKYQGFNLLKTTLSVITLSFNFLIKK